MVDKHKESKPSKNAHSLDIIRSRQYYGGVIVEDPGYRLRKERLKYIMRHNLAKKKGISLGEKRIFSIYRLKHFILKRWYIFLIFIIFSFLMDIIYFVLLIILIVISS